MILETVEVGLLQVNCYIIAAADSTEAIIIDPGDEEEKIRKVLDKHCLRAASVINTHGHIDHIGCDDKFGVPVYIHEDDMPLLRDPETNLSDFLGTPFALSQGCRIKPLKESDVIGSGDIKLKVIHTPGHTKGGISLFWDNPDKKVIFTGDSLFHNTIGRTDFAGASEAVLIKSIKTKLFSLPPDTIVCPGHGPKSTIGNEIKNNPFLN